MKGYSTSSVLYDGQYLARYEGDLDMDSIDKNVGLDTTFCVALHEKNSAVCVKRQKTFNFGDTILVYIPKANSLIQIKVPRDKKSIVNGDKLKKEIGSLYDFNTNPIILGKIVRYYSSL